MTCREQVSKPSPPLSAPPGLTARLPRQWSPLALFAGSRCVHNLSGAVGNPADLCRAFRDGLCRAHGVRVVGRKRRCATRRRFKKSRLLQLALSATDQSGAWRRGEPYEPSRMFRDMHTYVSHVGLLLHCSLPPQRASVYAHSARTARYLLFSQINKNCPVLDADDLYSPVHRPKRLEHRFAHLISVKDWPQSGG